MEALDYLVRLLVNLYIVQAQSATSHLPIPRASPAVKLTLVHHPIRNARDAKVSSDLVDFLVDHTILFMHVLAWPIPRSIMAGRTSCLSQASGAPRAGITADELISFFVYDPVHPRGDTCIAGELVDFCRG